MVHGIFCTGKTSFARSLHQFYFELGITNDVWIELRRDDMVGSAVGETEQKMKSWLEKVNGGMLSIG